MNTRILHKFPKGQVSSRYYENTNKEVVESHRPMLHHIGINLLKKSSLHINTKAKQSALSSVEPKNRLNCWCGLLSMQ